MSTRDLQPPASPNEPSRPETTPPLSDLQHCRYARPSMWSFLKTPMFYISMLSLAITLFFTIPAGKELRRSVDIGFFQQWIFSQTVAQTIVPPLALDLDEDGQKEIVLGYRSEGPDRGRLKAFTAQGKPFGQEIETNDRRYSNAGAQAGQFEIKQITDVDLFHDGHHQIVVLSEDPKWYISRTMIIQYSGNMSKVIGDYLHPGRLHKYFLVSQGNETILIAAGSNNEIDQHARFVFGLVLQDLVAQPGQTQAPPGRLGDEDGSLIPLFEGSWYYQILPAGDGIDRVFFTDRDHDGVMDLEFSSDAVTWFFKSDGRLMEVGKESGYQAKPEPRGFRFLVPPPGKSPGDEFTVPANW